MENLINFEPGDIPAGVSDTLFENMAADLLDKGYSIQPNGLPVSLAESLSAHLHTMSEDQFNRAGVGREQSHVINDFVRTDEICWISGESEAGKAWLNWTAKLQLYLNRRLLLGLFSFESHFAHYRPGDFYKKHLDAFKGEANRVLSLVVYLNHGWLPDQGGELVLYLGEESQDDKSGETVQITPAFGTVVAFLSEDFPHEVLPANRDRYSIAGWFRLNTSTPNRVDPPG